MFEKQGWEARVEEAAQKLNLQWYKNEDRYSDGDIEDDIIKYIAQYEPEDYDKAVLSIWTGRFIIILRM